VICYEHSHISCHDSHSRFHKQEAPCTCRIIPCTVYLVISSINGPVLTVWTQRRMYITLVWSCQKGELYKTSLCKTGPCGCPLITLSQCNQCINGQLALTKPVLRNRCQFSLALITGLVLTKLVLYKYIQLQ
jgi:hypothetical protein